MADSPRVTKEAKRHASAVVKALRKEYPDAVCTLNFKTPLQLLIATILSAQCTDERVNKVTKSLFAKYRSAADFAESELAELERDIQSTGFFRNKAKNIQGCCQILVERHRGKVPQDMEELVQLPGVGRKTASVVLGTAFGIASGVVVDTHVARISYRLGLTSHTDAKRIEEDLAAVVPRKEWIALSHRLIAHGRSFCTARKPKCEICPLRSISPKIGVDTG